MCVCVCVCVCVRVRERETVFRKTNYLRTFHNSRNTNLKYLMQDASLELYICIMVDQRVLPWYNHNTTQ